MFNSSDKSCATSSLQTNDVQLDAHHIVQLEPFGMVVGEVGSGEAQYLLYVERRVILESKGLLNLY